MLTSEQIAALRVLLDAATPGPWAQQQFFPLNIVPHDQRALKCGGAVDPDVDREQYAQPLARVALNEVPGDWRLHFPHKRLNRVVAVADAVLIVAAVNALLSTLSDLALLAEARESGALGRAARQWEERSVRHLLPGLSVADRRVLFADAATLRALAAGQSENA